MREPGHPWLPGWLTRAVPRAHREEWVGDLVERWHDERDQGTPTVAATGRLWWRLLRSAVEARRTDRALGAHVRGGATMGFGQDLRLAFRMLRREPMAAGVAFGTLAMGVWAFLVGFALVDETLIESLGYEGEERLALIGHGEAALFGISMPAHLELVEQNDVFEAASPWGGWSVLLRPEEGAWSRVTAASVASTYFPMLGVEPVLGRLFSSEDDASGHAPVAVLSHDTWLTRFGGRADVLGQSFEADGATYTIVGVVEDGFEDPIPRLLRWEQPELWRASPASWERARDARGQVSYWSLGRVRSGVPIAAASTDVRAREAEILGVTPAEVDVIAYGYRELLASGSQGSLLLLLGAGLVVLLVSAANLLNLLLARGTARRQEMAVRAAVGARRGRLVRQLLVESAVLGLMAAAVGIVLTRISLIPLRALLVPLLPAGAEPSVSTNVLLTAIGVSIVAAMAAALVPALGATRHRHLSGLRQGTRGAARSPLQTGLIVVQTALAVVLVTGSGLLLRSAWALAQVGVGFDPEAVTALRVPLYDQLFADDAEQQATLERLLERFAAIPGVGGAAAITDLPMSGRVNSTAIRRPDLPQDDDLGRLQTLVRAVDPAYFDVVGVDLVRGRALSPTDRRGTPEVAVVNETYDERHFPDGGSLGRTVFVRGVERTIVGVVEDVTEFSLVGGANPVLYLTYDQEVQNWMRSDVSIVMRTEGGPPSRAALVAAAAEVDERIPVGTPFPLSDFLDRDTAGHRFRALLATTLAALAMALASVGLGAVTAYLVRRRTRELGVRVALGAGPGRIAANVLGGSGAVALLGIVVGVAIAVPSGRILAAFLYEVPPVDPVSMSVAVLVLAASSLAAALAPTRRALRIAPVDALREE